MGRDLCQLQSHRLAPFLLKAGLSSPTPSCRERRQGTALPPAAHPNSYASSQLHLEPHGLCPLAPSGNTPHNQAQILVSPHPDRCTFPLISLQRGCTLLCPSRSQAQGDQPTLPLPFQQRGRARHDKASQSRERVSPPLPSWLPAATGWGSCGSGQLPAWSKRQAQESEVQQLPG